MTGDYQTDSVVVQSILRYIPASITEMTYSKPRRDPSHDRHIQN
jgi:hypothetical protein